MDWRLVPATACRGDQGTRTAPAETAKKEAESLAPIDELLAKPGIRYHLREAATARRSPSLSEQSALGGFILLGRYETFFEEE